MRVIQMPLLCTPCAILPLYTMCLLIRSHTRLLTHRLSWRRAFSARQALRHGLKQWGTQTCMHTHHVHTRSCIQCTHTHTHTPEQLTLASTWMHAIALGTKQTHAHSLRAPGDMLRVREYNVTCARTCSWWRACALCYLRLPPSGCRRRCWGPQPASWAQQPTRWTCLLDGTPQSCQECFAQHAPERTSAQRGSGRARGGCHAGPVVRTRKVHTATATEGGETISVDGGTHTLRAVRAVLTISLHLQIHAASCAYGSALERWLHARTHQAMASGPRAAAVGGDDATEGRFGLLSCASGEDEAARPR